MLAYDCLNQLLDFLSVEGIEIVNKWSTIVLTHTKSQNGRRIHVDKKWERLQEITFLSCNYN